MDKGLEFVQDNFKKILELVEKPEYNHLKSKVVFEWNSFRNLKSTNDIYHFFLKYADGSHKNAQDFEFLKDYGLLSSEKISDYLMEHYSDEIKDKFGVDNLVINDSYTNNDLKLLFNDFMHGIRSVREKKIIACVTSHDVMYEDEWLNKKTLLYTGEGQRGDQKPTSSGNKDLIMAATDKDWRVFLFEKIKPNKYYFRGEVEVDPIIRQKSNVLGDDYKPRTIIQYTLTIKGKIKEFNYTEEDSQIIENSKKKVLEDLKPDVIHYLAKSKNEDSKVKYVNVKQYNRDQYVSMDTKNRAKGKCDLCGNVAPFFTKDGPYLESHHVITLAEGGPDYIYNTVALCPNCHRKVHNLKDPKDIKKLAEIIKRYLLDDKDMENLNKWEALFNQK